MLERGGLVVRRLSTRCMFSCLPFCWGEAGSMNSGKIWSWTNQTESLERRPRALEAKGVPLSVRMRSGSPNLRKSLVNTGITPSMVTSGRPWQASRKRECMSWTVSG